jgi:hypothetical protein
MEANLCSFSGSVTGLPATYKLVSYFSLNTEASTLYFMQSRQAEQEINSSQSGIVKVDGVGKARPAVGQDSNPNLVNLYYVMYQLRLSMITEN